MVKRKRGVHWKSKKEQVGHDVLASDDEELYKDLGQADPESREYYCNEIDEFHENKEKILLENDARKKANESSDEEEVFGFTDDDDEFYRTAVQKDEMESDIEGNEEEDLPDIKAWGKKKSLYYDTDYVDKDFGGFAGPDVELAEAEEKEALALQKRLAEELNDADIGLEWFQPAKKVEEKEIKVKETVEKDLSRLSKKDRLDLLKKESPEFLCLVNDFKAKMAELGERIHPVVSFLEDVKYLASPEKDYLYMKYHLLLNYCTNLSFYMMLKAKRTPVQHHPIIKRLVQYRNLLKQLEPTGKILESDIDVLLKTLKENETVSLIPRKNRVQDEDVKHPKSAPTKRSNRTSKRRAVDETDITPEAAGPKKVRQLLTQDEKEVLSMYRQMRQKMAETEEEQLGNNDDEMVSDVDKQQEHSEQINELSDTEQTKRGVTYEIAKNKGLIPHRKKEYRNPRVRNRMKYRKAKIRRRGQVREARTETARYSGEHSGIRSGVIRSIKLK